MQWVALIIGLIGISFSIWMGYRIITGAIREYREIRKEERK